MMCPSVICEGSSPLARGLRRSQSSHRPLPGIIPARAGFTRASPSARPQSRDHPRSRGVYLRGRSGRCLPWRIIPARAGFTPQTGDADERPWDHPRSRGVYYEREGKKPEEPGSSPLARGLRSLPGHVRVRFGIIPARAGFTRSFTAPPAAPGDHPRSRGVYRRLPLPRGGLMGSSPLARGLLAAVLDRILGARIIPARAGFTCIGGSRRRGSSDHPRSRGVY